MIIAVILGLIVAAIVWFVLRWIGLPLILAGLAALLVFLAFVFGDSGYY